MSFVVKESGGSFKPAPAGPALAVCCDVVDLGIQDSAFRDADGNVKRTHKCRLVFQLAEEDPELGKRPIVSQLYTASLNEKANLRQHLESWRGRPFTALELRGFDLESVIGVSAFLNVVHRESGGSTFANVAAIMPPPKGTPKIPVEGYTRVKDRPPKDAPAQHEDRDAGDDDSVPF